MQDKLIVRTTSQVSLTGRPCENTLTTEKGMVIEVNDVTRTRYFIPAAEIAEVIEHGVGRAFEN